MVMIIGRKQEIQSLNKLYNSPDSELLVVYGRRRVGKTYLIREYLKEKEHQPIHVTGLHKGKLREQLTIFAEEVSKKYYNNADITPPASWEDAFKLLNNEIERTNNKTVIFLDELPWLATRKSNLLQVIDRYWNQHWSHNKKVFLVLCGSSASWLIKKIINDKGGLHNRITGEMRLLPLSLKETKDYLHYKNIKLNNRHLTKLYMALGGIPYYLNYIEAGKTSDQNIQKIIFNPNAPLRKEFNKLFASLFKQSEAYITLIKIIASKRNGISRTDIYSTLKSMSNGGRLSARLDELCQAGFIQAYIPWNKNQGEYYKLIDEFCLFYLSWVKNESTLFTDNHWINVNQSQSYKAWSGYAFEALCWKHVNQIIHLMGITAGGTISSWRYRPTSKSQNGAQIDLLIDRNDDAISLCEIKFTEKVFTIDKAYAKNLFNKIEVFKQITKTKKQVFLSVISATGLKQNEYSTILVDSTVSIDDLF